MTSHPFPIHFPSIIEEVERLSRSHTKAIITSTHPDTTKEDLERITHRQRRKAQLAKDFITHQLNTYIAELEAFEAELLLEDAPFAEDHYTDPFNELPELDEEAALTAAEAQVLEHTRAKLQAIEEELSPAAEEAEDEEAFISAIAAEVDKNFPEPKPRRYSYPPHLKTKAQKRRYRRIIRKTTR